MSNSIFSIIGCITLSTLAIVLARPALESNQSVKIVGGQNASIEDYPYTASLLFMYSHICGAAIISNKYVLTTATCAQHLDAEPRNLNIRAGSSTWQDFGDISQFISVGVINIHPEYNPDTLENDLAVLELEKPLRFDDTVQLIPLPDSDYVPADGANATITGWGYEHEDDYWAYPNYLHVTQVSIVDLPSCQSNYNNANLTMTVTDKMICAGAADHDWCGGDEGGPLVVDGVLVGIASWGNGCGRVDYPSVYINVAAYRSYIDNLIN